MKLTLHCFGASTTSGEALHNIAGNDFVGYSRNPSPSLGWLYPADLCDPFNFHPAGLPSDPSVWISFAPIWLLAPFLDHIAQHHHERIQGLCGVIACSSSSAITKRFAFNSFDRHLVAKLISSEDQLLSTCRRLSLPCRVLRPTMIYGQVGPYSDRNLTRILQQLRRLPVLPLPADSGLRQPIHASQLAAVALHLSKQFLLDDWQPSLPDRIAVGGDTTLTYAQMIRALQQALHPADPARRCHLVSIPNHLFFLLATPLLLRSPKAFEAVLRMGANLSDFTPAHQLLGSNAQPFPILSLA